MYKECIKTKQKSFSSVLEKPAYSGRSRKLNGLYYGKLLLGLLGDLLKILS